MISLTGNCCNVLLLDLCSGSGAWSQPYVDAGWIVDRMTLPELDVRDLEYRETHYHGVLAAPPCTMFANSGARWERSEEEVRGALSVVDACLRAVTIYRPSFWCLENPIGKLA